MQTNMWGFYYEMVSNLLFLLAQAVASVCLGLLCKRFFENRKCAWMVGAVYLAVMVLLYYIPAEIGNFTAYLLGSVVSLVGMLCVDRGNANLKIFVSVIFFALRWIGSSVSDAAVIVLDKYLTGWMLAGGILEENGNEIYYFILYCASGVIRMLLRFAVLWILVSGVSRVFRMKSGKMSIKELLILSIPSILAMINYAIVLRYNSVFVEIGMYLPDTHLDIELLWMVCQMVLAAGILVEIILFQNLKEKQETEKEHDILQHQICEMQAHIGEVEQIYAGIRGVKHDLNSHISVMAELIEQQQYEAAQDYLKTLYQTAERFDYKIKTGNPVTDVIINEKAEKAKKEGIDFESGFYYPSGTCVNAFDVSVLLNNALENAFEAVSAGGFITVTSHRNKNAYFIEVANSYASRLSLSADGHFPKTTKPDEKQHGLGLKNMRKVAQRYCGDVELLQSRGEVKLTAMLMLK